MLVPAHLYLPTDRSGPLPGVLFQMGHHPAGKAAAAYQRCCQGLARLGFVVLAFDPAGEGERVYYPLAGSRASRLGSPDAEHDRAGRQLLLVGDSATRLELWDAVRGLDVLASRPEVDPSRLASAGHSGGGTLTMLLAAVEERLAAAAISGANLENVACVGFEPPAAVDDAEQNLIGAGPLGLDRWDLLLPLAPRPLLVMASAEDPFTTYSPRYLTSAREGFAELARAYDTLDAGARLRWAETALPHGLSPGLRLEIYRWLGRWLQGEGEVRDEPAVAPEPEEATWVAPGGDVTRAFGGRTPFDLTRARAAALPAPRPPGDLAALLGVTRPPRGLRASLLDATPSEGSLIEALEVRAAPSVWVPAWLFRPAERPPRSLVIVVEPEGRSARWREDDPWQCISRGGDAVCAADVRGVGDLRPELGRGAPDYAAAHGTEDSFAWTSLVLGESLLAQRVRDLLALVEALSGHPPVAGRPLILAARGALTLPALFAAALEPRIEALHLEGGLASYRSAADTEDYLLPLAGVVPGVLAHTDLPQVAAALAPRRVILAGPVDGAGRPMPLAQAREIYRDAPNVRVREGGAWGERILARSS